MFAGSATTRHSRSSAAMRSRTRRSRSSYSARSNIPAACHARAIGADARSGVKAADALHQIVGSVDSRGVAEPTAMTVQRCLRAAPLDTARIVAGMPGVAARRVRWVAVIEWPVEDFVARDEFVLTTGIGCDEAQFTQLVTEVADAEAAALCLAVGPGAPYPAAPAGALAVADERGMPLIEIPWEVRFADVLRSLTDRLLSARYAATMGSPDRLPAGFTDALLHRHGLRAIAEALEGMTERGVLVLDSN